MGPRPSQSLCSPARHAGLSANVPSGGCFLHPLSLQPRGHSLEPVTSNSQRSAPLSNLTPSFQITRPDSSISFSPRLKHGKMLHRTHVLTSSCPTPTPRSHSPPVAVQTLIPGPALPLLHSPAKPQSRQMHCPLSTHRATSTSGCSFPREGGTGHPPGQHPQPFLCPLR